MPLSAEIKASILTQRIQQFEQDLYQHELNKVTAEALNLPTAEAEDAIAQLTTAISVHAAELAALEES